MLDAMDRPPLRLEVAVRTPSGVNARWAADEPLPGNQPQNLTFSTTMPGGFESFSLTLQRDPRIGSPDLEELAEITIRGLGGSTIAWQGRLEQVPDTGGWQAQVSPAGSGYQNALQDNNSAAMIYLDQALSNWQGPPLNRQISLTNAGYGLGSNSTGADPGDNQPALILEVDDSWTTAIPFAEAWYDSGVAAPIARLYWQYAPGAISGTAQGGGSWVDGLAVSLDDAAATTLGTGNISSADGSNGLFTPGELYRYALLQHYFNAENGGTSGAAFQAFWQLAVLGNHGLPIQGTWPGNIGILASDIVRHAVAMWAAEIGFTTGSQGTIQPSAFAIPQLAFTTPTTAAAIIQQAVQYELLDWAVWEGPMFWLNPMGTSAKTRNWRCRIGECQPQETGPDITRLFNGVVVQFTNVDGTNGTVGPPGSGAQTTSGSLLDTDPQNPANQAGITKYGTLQMGTTTPAAAIQVGAIYLQAQKQLDTSGQASLVGHVQDDRGVYWPAWMVRAGDTLSIVDASDTSPRRITATSYTDSSKTNAVTLGSPPDTTTALLERLSAVIQPLGLS